jgi:hypothetical protein
MFVYIWVLCHEFKLFLSCPLRSDSESSSEEADMKVKEKGKKRKKRKGKVTQGKGTPPGQGPVTRMVRHDSTHRQRMLTPQQILKAALGKERRKRLVECPICEEKKSGQKIKRHLVQVHGVPDVKRAFSVEFLEVRYRRTVALEDKRCVSAPKKKDRKRSWKLCPVCGKILTRPDKCIARHFSDPAKRAEARKLICPYEPAPPEEIPSDLDLPSDGESEEEGHPSVTGAAPHMREQTEDCPAEGQGIGETTLRRHHPEASWPQCKNRAVGSIEVPHRRPQSEESRSHKKQPVECKGSEEDPHRRLHPEASQKGKKRAIESQAIRDATHGRKKRKGSQSGKKLSVECQASSPHVMSVSHEGWRIYIPQDKQVPIVEAETITAPWIGEFLIFLWFWV